MLDTCINRRHISSIALTLGGDIAAAHWRLAPHDWHFGRTGKGSNPEANHRLPRRGQPVYHVRSFKSLPAPILCVYSLFSLLLPSPSFTNLCQSFALSSLIPGSGRTTAPVRSPPTSPPQIDTNSTQLNTTHYIKSHHILAESVTLCDNALLCAGSALPPRPRRDRVGR
jgi:hypothetical protein